MGLAAAQATAYFLSPLAEFGGPYGLAGVAVASGVAGVLVGTGATKVIGDAIDTSSSNTDLAAGLAAAQTDYQQAYGLPGMVGATPGAYDSLGNITNFEAFARFANMEGVVSPYGDSPSESIGGPGTLNYDSQAAVKQAIANGADPYTFQQSASAPAQAPGGIFGSPTNFNSGITVTRPSIPFLFRSFQFASRFAPALARRAAAAKATLDSVDVCARLM
ncbi:MAG: hypothetical protein ABSF67_18655 [Roseiarcus sp.]|jgi:hypothetical protein